MSKKLIAPLYMHSFRCLGGDCEDTCCQNWDISIDKYHYDLLLNKVENNQEDKALFERSVLLHKPENSSEKNYAYIQKQASGFCPFYTGQGLCHIHARYGVEPLNDTCTFFPRVLSEREEVVELTAALSCPEVVRQCLMSDQKQQVMQEVDQDILPRSDFPVARVIDEPENCYAEKFQEVRAAMIELMNDDEYSFEARLYFLANFGYRLSSHYHQGCDSNLRVDEEIKRIKSKEIRNQLDDYYFNFSNEEPIAIVVIQAILQLRIQHEGNDKLSQMAKQILDKYRVNYERSEDFDVYGENIPPDILARAYQQHWDNLNTNYGVTLEEYFSRYVINCLQREWFVSMPDPFTYIQMLIIRVAVLRFLITSHPDIITLMKSNDVNGQQLDKFNNKIVEIVYLYARSIDHNLTFLQVVYQAMLEQQMMTFDYSMAFIKF
ncbi:MAG: flagellin lysine-N-methylase [Thioalkalispiraceae bacterium]|jgi:lysine-N-methylase